jgi:hypothetical protein
MLERMIEGSKVRSKGGRVRKHTTLNGCGLKGALERKGGLKGAIEKKRGLKGALERTRGLKGTLERR